MNSTNNRVLAEVMDSPLGLSPMGNLAVNFNGTSLDSTPSCKFRGRRLSMSNLTPSSTLDSSSLLDSSDGKCGTPRISKNTLTTFARRGSLMRRMNSAPSPSCTSDNENRQEGNKKTGEVVLKFNPDKKSSPGNLLKQDGDSMDSGFTELCPVEINETVSESPKENSSQFSVYQSPGRRKLSAFSFCSANYYDDGFLEVSDLEKSFTDENEELPVGMGNLLKGPLIGSKKGLAKDQDKGISNNSSSRPPLRRFNSLMENNSSPASSKARVGLFLDEAQPEETFSPCENLPFKRPREIDVNSSKRKKSNSVHTISERFVREKSKSRYKLQRSISETAASSLSLMLHKSDLIADFTRPYALPIVSGRHEDLKSITPDTLAGLLNGDFSSKVDSFRIIDCRYPYEYEGGHIRGSINLYTREHVEQELFAGKSQATQDLDSSREETKSDERNILIFHCEFSLERGPALYRYLRRCDRNVSHYPTLHYPEVYLLHGGYENFFSTHKSLCEPCSYQPMVDPKHESDLRKFRIKSNSWSGDQKRNASRSGLKRLGLF